MISGFMCPVHTALHRLAFTAALKAIHSAGVLHGDLNPRNLVVDARGAVAIIDFGRSIIEPSGITDADQLCEKLKLLNVLQGKVTKRLLLEKVPVEAPSFVRATRKN